ncbi:hypothetical protein LEP1GSC096_0024 [Leptospira interrogans serovar Hebdomadis str. R499]|uniref:hypothetical protein n=1 Tax=Leptospira interrogans TaxID=173 RepID=UPI000297CC79|nr:hypothetical protein [Leptospira interrogans]EKR34392.1 hypothetical protein LEP1GSC096_0024 [Leptospira interrogans serovar Hebdomadis str. R499]
MIGNTSSFQPIPLRGIQKFDDLFTKIKQYWDLYSKKINYIRYLRRADLTEFPEERAYAIGAFYDTSESIKRIRQAIHEAPKIQRRPASFQLSWKGKIDQITGGDSNIFYGPKLAKSFLIRQSVIADIDELGQYLDAQPYSARLNTPNLGHIMINLNTSATPSDTILNQIVALLRPIKNLYMSIEIGILGHYQYGNFEIGKKEIGGNNFVLGSGQNISGDYFLPLRSI